MDRKFVYLITVKDYKEFNTNYPEYTKELYPYMSEKGKLEQDAFIPDFEEDDNRFDYWIFNEEDKCIGFVMIGLYPNSFSKHSVFIQQLFIKPEYQRQGYGFFTVEDICERFSMSDICMFILSKNIKAIQFWEKAMLRLNFRDEFQFSDVTASKENGEIIFKYFSK